MIFFFFKSLFKKLTVVPDSIAIVQVKLHDIHKLLIIQVYAVT